MLPGTFESVNEGGAAMRVVFLFVAVAWAAFAALPGQPGDPQSRAGVKVQAPRPSAQNPPFGNDGGTGTVDLTGRTPVPEHDPRVDTGGVWVDLGLPNYAGSLGLAPGNYEPWYGLKSSATVHVIRPPQASKEPRQLVSYSKEITTAVVAFGSSDKALETMDDGVRRFRARDYAGAADSFLKAAPLTPDNALPHFAFGHALFALGAYSDAAYQLRRGFELMPAWVGSGTRLQDLYGEVRDFEDQTAALRAHRSIHPEDDDALLVAAYVAFFSGDLDGADGAFAKLVERDRDVALAQCMRTEIEAIRARIAK